MFWIVLLLIVVAAAYVLHKFNSTKTEVSAESSERAEGQAPAPPLAMDEMRDQMNKAAYEMVGNTHDAETKARFKQGMTEFASADPLVKEIVVRVRALVEESPGLLQSGIYSSLPEYSQEQVRYALYFAHELGWVLRKKKGRSYQLFPPGETIDSSAVNNHLLKD